MELAHNIKRIRKRWRMDQEEFGSFFQVSRGAISMYETEQNEPRLKFLLTLYELSGVDLYMVCTAKLRKEDIPEKPYPPGTKHQPAIADPEEMQDIDQQVAEMKAIIQELSSRIERIEKSP